MMKGPGDPGPAADPADLWVNEDHFNGGFFNLPMNWKKANCQ
jgi:hypothetical protein